MQPNFPLITLDVIERNLATTETVRGVITPEIAAYLLTKNDKNRLLKEPDAEVIAKDILEGRWHDNGDTIKISIDGYLNDGQHRLRGIMISGKPVMTRIAFGLTRESRETLDQGKKRSAGDIIAMQTDIPKEYSKTVGAVAEMILQYEHSGGKRIKDSRNKLSAGQTLRKAEEDSQILASVKWAAGHYNGHRQYASPSIIAFIHYILHNVNANGISGIDFVTELASGEHNRPEVTSIRTRLLDEGKKAAEVKIYLILKCWDALYNGKTLKRIHLTGFSALPTIQP